MGSVSYKVSVPGTLMVFGEHAVLQNKQAVVTAVDSYLSVILTPTADRNIYINSELTGTRVISLDNFRVVKPYNYILMAIESRLKNIKTGFSLEVISDFSADIGFGSSAAVTVATLKALSKWLDKKLIDPMKLYKKSIGIVRDVQGCGSGADVAATVFDGVIAYKMKPVTIKKIADRLPLVAVYSGSKLATAKVVEQVKKSKAKFPKVFADIYSSIDKCSIDAIKAIKDKDYIRLGRLMDIHQGLQESLGVSNSRLSELTYSLRDKKGIYGAKISGSGLGDCVIGLGKIKKNIFPENELQNGYGVRQIF